LIGAAGDEHPSVGQANGGVLGASFAHRAGRLPGRHHRVEDHRRCESGAVGAGAARDENPTIEEARRGRCASLLIQVLDPRPAARSRVVSLGGPNAVAAGHQHRAVCEQRGRCRGAGLAHRGGRRPGEGRRVMDEAASDGDGGPDEREHQEDGEGDHGQPMRRRVGHRCPASRPGPPVENRQDRPTLGDGGCLRKCRLDERGRDARGPAIFEDLGKHAIDVEGCGHAGCPPMAGERSPAAIAARSDRVA
jgi:hypothetical protein